MALVPVVFSLSIMCWSKLSAFSRLVMTSLVSVFCLRMDPDISLDKKQVIARLLEVLIPWWRLFCDSEEIPRIGKTSALCLIWSLCVCVSVCQHWPQKTPGDRATRNLNFYPEVFSWLKGYSAKWIIAWIFKRIFCRIHAKLAATVKLVQPTI